MNDFGRTASDYAQYRRGFPRAFYDRLQAAGFIAPGRNAADLGTGTGDLALGLARAGLHVVGVDIAPALLEQARRLSTSQKLDVQFVEASAETTGLAADHFDVVTAGQCWHWFDRPRAAAECRRLLRAGGYLVLAHLDWIPYDGNVVATTVQAIADFGCRFSNRLDASIEGLYPAWTVDMRQAGFTAIETFSFDVTLPYTKSDWRGRVRASAPIGGTLDQASVDRFDTFFATRLERYPEQLAVPHRVWAAVARKPQP